MKIFRTASVFHIVVGAMRKHSYVQYVSTLTVIYVRCKL